ncbi:hypothetical protein DPMN_022171 [Dreissena polymorpha]|uniref:Uncharacterized protein n=1 Tax=Dreissena polymorpha TaxID=45954 RepID=A0A9D4SBL2_DREPO|nr:hypothetical protein DPMN_022171 [Dreissena polymorpha]
MSSRVKNALPLNKLLTRKNALPLADAGAPGLVMGPCIVEIDRIVIRECRNEEIIVKDNFGWVWPMWPGRPRVCNGAMHIEIDCIVIREAQYQIEEQVTRTDGQMHITTISPLFLRKTWG